MAKVFIIMFIVFIILGIAAIIHAAITAPTLDEDNHRLIHWKKAKAYFKNKDKLRKENAAKEEIDMADILTTPAKLRKIVYKKPVVYNKDGSVRKKPGPKLGSHNKKKKK